MSAIKKSLFSTCLLLMASQSIATEALKPEQFAEAITLTPAANHPVQQLLLPDAVYQRVVSPQLHDVAVFDAAGVRVPHVWCAGPSQETATDAYLPVTVFPVRSARIGGQGATAEVRTESGNRIAITVPGANAEAEAVAVTAYDLELSALTEPVLALQVQWHSPTGLSELHLKVEQAAAGQPWQLLVADAVLKRVTAEGRTLEYADIKLPAAHYQNLRLTPRDASGAVIDAVQVHTRSNVAAAAALRWFAARPVAASATDADQSISQSYDAEHQAPVTAAWVQLTAPNSRSHYRLQSRPDVKALWRTVAEGEAFNLLTPSGERRNGQLTLQINHERYWRLLGDAGSAPIEASLLLGYVPQNLRFIAQGQAPYRLAYGNAQALAATPSASCDSLLSSLLQAGQTDAESLIGSATAGAPQVLAGAAALQAPTRPDWRRWLLWSVLAVAVLLLLGMARKLLADLKTST